VRDEIAPASTPLSAAPIELEDAARCGKGTVCADCVGSAFTDIWSCGACAWCLGF
jgi:hypothetical protein